MPVVYRHFDREGTLLYVGSTSFFFARQQHHSRSPWFPDLERIDLEHFETIQQARTAEWLAISAEKPLYNKVGTRGVRPPNPALLINPDDEVEAMTNRT